MIDRKKKIVLVVGFLFVLIPTLFGYLHYARGYESDPFPYINEENAGKILNEGCAYYDQGEYEKAIEKWEIVYYYYRGTCAWYKATYNLGIGYMALKDYDKAIDYFLILLESDADDTEPGESIMETARNYHHSACWRLADCYEMKGDYETALEYMILARDEYTYYSWCGTCAAGAHESLIRRIGELEILIAWEEDKSLKSSFYWRFDIQTDSNNEYNISIPVPVYHREFEDYYGIHYTLEISPVMENLEFLTDVKSYSIVNTSKDWMLNITSIGNCSFEIKYDVPNGSSENPDVYDGFSKYDYGGFELPYESKNMPDAEVSFSMDLQWMKFPPDVEYESIQVEDQVGYYYDGAYNFRWSYW